jgi:hypothetical protein
MSGARTGILVDAFLHKKCRLLVDEVGQPGKIADRRRAAKKFE